MQIDLLLYLVILMIMYDLSVHLVYLCKKDELILKKKINWWPQWWGVKYQIFWISFWSIALILLVIYALLK